MKRHFGKWTIIGFIGLVLFGIIGYRLMGGTFNTSTRVPAEDLKIYEVNEGYYEAAKNGHFIKVDESLEDGKMKCDIKRILYDSKLLLIDVVFKNEISSHTMLTITDTEGNQIGPGAFSETLHDEESEYAFRFSFDMLDDVLEESVIQIHQVIGPWRDRVIKEEPYVEVKLDKKILKKQPRIYKINKTLEQDGVEVYLDRLEVYPLTARMKIQPKKSTEEFVFSGIDSNIKNWAGEEKNTSQGARSILEDGTQTVVYQSDYFKKTENKMLSISNITLRRKESYEMKIDTVKKELESNCHIEFNIYEIVEDNEGRIESFSIESKDERSSNNFLGMEDVKIDGVSVSGNRGSSTRSSGGEISEIIYRFRLKEPIKGEEITFIINNLQEKIEVEKNIKMEKSK